MCGEMKPGSNLEISKLTNRRYRGRERTARKQESHRNLKLLTVKRVPNKQTNKANGSKNAAQ